MESKTFRVGSLIQSSDRILHDAYLSLSVETRPRILAVGPWKEYRGPQSFIDMSDCVLFPGWINAHCHFEFSDLEIPFHSRNGTFSDWIEQVIVSRFEKQSKRSAEQIEIARTDAIQNGINESMASGTAACGDIVTRPFVSFGGHTLECTNFLEILGLSSERSVAAMEWARELIENQTQHQRFGISPHAPYSTSTKLYEQAVRLAQKHNIPLATHLAESEEELQLLRDKSGPLVELFRKLNVWNAAAVEANSVDEVIGILKPLNQVLLIHGNFLQAVQWRSLPKANWSVVYCPQTHQHFQHPAHCWPEMLKDGINVALGTDSRASSKSLNLWDDIQIACRNSAEHSPALVFKMATENGAKALGCSAQCGTIDIGNHAVLQVAKVDPPFHWEQFPSLKPVPF